MKQPALQGFRALNEEGRTEGLASHHQWSAPALAGHGVRQSVRLPSRRRPEAYQENRAARNALQKRVRKSLWMLYVRRGWWEEVTG